MEEEYEEEQEFQDAQSDLQPDRVARPVTVTKPPRRKSSSGHKKREKREVQYSSPGNPLSRKAHHYKEHRRISRGSVSSDSSTNGTQFTTRAPANMPKTKKKTGNKPAPKAAAQPPASDEESPRAQRQKRRQKNTDNLPSTKKQKQQEQEDDDGSDVDYTSDEEEEQVVLSKKELEELLKNQAMVTNFIKAQEKTQQARVKSGRAKVTSEVLGSYNPQTMTQEQREIQKHFKRYVFRLANTYEFIYRAISTME